MLLSTRSLLSFALSIALTLAQPPNITSYSAADIYDGTAWQDVTSIAEDNMHAHLARRRDQSCSIEDIQERREWRSIPSLTRQSYVAAVTCLMELPPQVMTSAQSPQYPGVKSRYDEYVATHINYTLNIHGTADFLAWHRQFVYLYNCDLQELCGYDGPIPYWDWPLDSEAPQDSPLFSGDDDSLGSNGAYIPGRSNTFLSLQQVLYPPGTGGGCVQSGPFANYTVNLGPLDEPDAHEAATPFAWNPHCLVRDINPFFSQQYTSWMNVTELVLESSRIEDFQAWMQGFWDMDHFGVHGGGHWQVQGDMQSFHSSPSDPIFFLHHANIDRVWTIWQNLDITQRQDVIYGTSTIDNNPPSANMTLDDMLPFGLVAPDVRFGDLMDTFGGDYCYWYV